MDITCLGEMVIDMFPAEIGRHLAEVTAFHPKPGGAPANVAVAARRLGAQTAFIGKVGDDAFGYFLIDVLKEQGVETAGMRIDNEARTTMAVIALPDKDTAEFVFYRNPGADQRLHPQDLDVSLLEHTRVLHFGSVSLSDEPSRSATIEAVRIATASGALISFDVNYRPSLWADPEVAVAQVMSMIPQVDLLKVNEVELALLAGGSSLQGSASALLDMGPELVVVTLGSDGSYFCTTHGEGHVPAIAVETVDAVGCGDAFVAAVLTQLIAAPDWRTQISPQRMKAILEYANTVGALTATKQGVIPALPTSAEVAQFLNQCK